MRKIPYIDLIGQHAAIKEEIMSAVSKVLDHGHFILGPEVEEFENKLSDYLGSKYIVAVNSGTDALFLSLKAYGIGAGDEVITAPNSFLSTASVIAAAGARPVFVDVGSDMNIDPELIEAKLIKKTKAIIPVHLTGRPAAMEPIMALAKRHGLVVIEDAAQAIGAEYRGQKVGTIGTIGCFSLHPLKNLNACGDGGFIATEDQKICTTLKQLRNIGLKNRDESEIWGFNSRLDAFQAAIVGVKLKYLAAWTAQRIKNARFYTERLKDVCVVPVDKPGEKAVYHTYVVRVKERDRLMARLEKNGVTTRVHYPIPIHLQKVCQSYGYKKGDFPVCERQAGEILSLPVYPGLTEADLAYVCDLISGFYSEGK
ncbi:MAG: DegT/DnrJ/EryC1/StrS family aminotransferase [Candidatus Margulisbacteria bacterium]|nr:DegT/DnrJ/EryC1/StrS family aminotransferase [Candidatus Margulisiibacteriota bacterium]